ncbi:MAG: sigma-70 family RNA polymerase sigma factor [Sporocytophaga sp.]|uniref:RNA polymerase sigma factor n=1 Tax=Sporocytophaga sp. TaxID=2231183 RepID=UPI001B17CD36|nr:sigma-70 family RNA polymerase sigma factor [Sporocytophaga sp.]MBO9702833.1 sigma-70 family RNA polymerase sigma factor [Sporocytophaga sp.]
MAIVEKDIPDLIKQGKDKEVISLFYKLVYPRVKKTILNRGGKKEDVEDVFQDAVMYLYKHILEGKYNDKYTVYGFLFTLCINRWINSLRKSNKSISVDFQSEENIYNIEADFQEIYPAAMEENLLSQLFSQIGSKCIEILNYTIYQNLMMEDIQIRMGLESEGAAKMALKRCREKLYKEIENNPLIIQKLKGHV